MIILYFDCSNSVGGSFRHTGFEFGNFELHTRSHVFILKQICRFSREAVSEESGTFLLVVHGKFDEIERRASK